MMSSWLAAWYTDADVYRVAAVLPTLANMGEGAWLDDQAARARDDRLFVAMPIFLAAGTRAG